MDDLWSDDDFFMEDSSFDDSKLKIPAHNSAISSSAPLKLTVPISTQNSGVTRRRVSYTKTSKSVSTSSVLLTASHKYGKWMSPSFDDFSDLSTSSQSGNGCINKSTRVRQSQKQLGHHKESTGTNVPATRTKESDVSKYDLWVDKYAPALKSELIVHAKKVTEVENWLTSFYQSTKHRHPYLLLTGPGGCGKTATLRTLCRHLSCDVREWCNVDTERLVGMMDDTHQHHNWEESRFSSRYQDSQATQFRDFLLRSNKYNALQIFQQNHSPRKLILVEEFPNAFLRDATAFHEIVRQFERVAQCPVVFIVSDSSRSNSIEQRLFPRHFIDELHVANISFNAVAVTLMTKLLHQVADKEFKKRGSGFVMPDQGVIESLAMSGSGDIRGSLNALQFTCLRGYNPKHPSSHALTAPLKRARSGKGRGKLPKGSTKAFMPPEDAASIGAPDTSMFLFRALGKILYCKRTEEDDLISPTLPPHLSHHHRPPLAFSPQDVIDRSHISGALLVSYLHQNYLPFYTNIDDVMRASDFISDSDYLISHWQSRESLDENSVHVAVRGLVHCNCSVSKGGSWRPLHKSQWFSTRTKMQRNCETVQGMFRGLRCTTNILFTDLLPYLSLTRVSLHDPNEIAFIHDIANFPHCANRRQGEASLGEKDVIGEECESLEESCRGEMSSSQSNVVPQEDSDEVLIEEYDD